MTLILFSLVGRNVTNSIPLHWELLVELNQVFEIINCAVKSLVKFFLIMYQSSTKNLVKMRILFLWLRFKFFVMVNRVIISEAFDKRIVLSSNYCDSLFHIAELGNFLSKSFDSSNNLVHSIFSLVYLSNKLIIKNSIMPVH